MQKELNPELFGSGVAGQTRFIENSPSVHKQSLLVEEKIAELRAEVKQTTEQMANVVAQINEFIKSYNLKMEKLQTEFAQLTKNYSASHSEVGQRMTQIHIRLNERKSMDLKIQDLVDKQNGILKSYEVRVSNLARLISEKEAQLLSAQAALNEAKMEITRLIRL